MKNTILKISLFSIVCVALLLVVSPVVFGAQALNLYTETRRATSIQNNQATLNADISGAVQFNTNVWFEWGPTTNYGSQTPLISLNVSALTFNHTISGLASNTLYHYRIVAQTGEVTAFGQDMTFVTSGGYYSGAGSLVVTKKVINLTSGNLNWQTSVAANPSDVLSFAITLQAVGADMQNVTVTDVLPQGLIYRGNLTVNAALNYQGNITSGVIFGTIPAGQVAVISYQAQVAPVESFSYGATTLTSASTISASNVSTQTASASVLVNRSLVQGASIISTGLTNNFLRDSFFVPLLIIIAGLWLGFSGQAAMWVDKIKARIKR